MIRVFESRYTHSGPIYKGGTGVVFVCDDSFLHRKVAIKFLDPYRDKKQAYDEINALQMIRSKHVVQFYDVVIEQPDNQIGIVQEFVEGQDLVTFAKGGLTPEQLLRVLYQIASGMADVHAVDVIHRDLKPNNMKFDGEGIVKIFDFDLARKDNGLDAKTIGFKGTYGFAAPELFKAGHVTFTKAVDVYAFGATAAFLAFGQWPAELVEIPPKCEDWLQKGGFSQAGAKLPVGIVSVLNQTLRLSPSERPTMVHIRETLAAHMVRGRHRALFTYGGRTTICDKNNTSVMLNTPVGNVQIGYDGFGFFVTTVSGDVAANNHPLQVGQRLQSSCVISLGGPSLPNSARTFVTFDVSHPEVVL